MKKTLTISIPVYNGGKFILEALTSVIEQSVKVDQIIVSDNHSTDNTVEIVNEFIADHPELDILLNINSKNLGYQGNFNKCLELAKTDFLVIMNVDDRFKPEALNKQIDFLNKNPEFALVGGNEDIMDEGGKIILAKGKTENKIFKKGQILEYIKSNGTFIPPSTVMLNMNYIKEIGFFDEIMLAPDERYWIRVLRKHPIALLGESIIDRRHHPGQTGNKDFVEKYNETIEFFEDCLNFANYESSPDRINETKKIIIKFNANRARFAGIISWKDFSKPGIAIKYWRYGFRRDPDKYISYFFIKNLTRLILNR